MYEPYSKLSIRLEHYCETLEAVKYSVLGFKLDLVRRLLSLL